MNLSRFAAFPGQQRTALDQVSALLQSAPPTSRQNLVQPVEVFVGAVVRRSSEGNFLHVPHCSSIFRRSRVWSYNRGQANEGQSYYRFDQDRLPFHDAEEGEAGLLHYFGLFGTNSENGTVVTPLAVEWLPMPEADADGFEFRGGAEWAAEQHCERAGLGDFHDRYQGQVHQLMADRAIVLQQPSRFRVRVGGTERTLCDLGIAGRLFSPTAKRERAYAARNGELLTMAQCN